jgi:transposase
VVSQVSCLGGGPSVSDARGSRESIEGTWAAWLYDLLKPHVTEVLVCNPRKIALLKQGNKSDKIDARKLAERLRLHDLKPIIIKRI